VRRPAASSAALAALLFAAAVFLFYETRGTTLWFDEWDFVLNRRGTNLATFLAPHGEHASLVPVVLYKLLFATVGIERSAPYRALVIVAHLLCVALLFLYARRRAGEAVALLAAVSLLLLGPAWQNFIWPFQVGWLTSLAAGLGALLALDRRNRTGDLTTAGLLSVSLASSGLGLPIAAGVVVELLLRREWRRMVIILAVPVALYAVWWVVYHPAGVIVDKVGRTPRFVVEAAASATSALAGRAGSGLGASSPALDWGRPLASVAAVAVVWRMIRMRPVPPRVWALLVIVFSFWILTGLRRAGFVMPYASRYLYVGALYLLLLGVELVAGLKVSRVVLGILACAVAVAVAFNVRDLREGAAFLREQGVITRAAVGALEIARPIVQPDFVDAGVAGYPFVLVRAGPYFTATRALGGTPAATPEEIAASPEPARRVADAELITIHRVAPRREARARPAGTPPAVDGVRGGPLTRRGSCTTLRSGSLELTVPPHGLQITADGGPAELALRRFATGFTPQRSLRGSGPATLRFGHDLAPQPWHVRLMPRGRVTACSL
jgi:hypothetical protein